MSWSATDLLARHAREAPGAPALVDGDSAWSWTELGDRVEAATAALAARGVRPGQRVALVAATTPASIAALFGTLRTGAVGAPVPGGLTAREVDVALGVIEPALVVRDADLPLEAAPDPDIADARARDPEAPALVVLTSGTTGRPKGVVLSTRAMAASADAWLEVLPPATGWAMPLGIGHVAGLGILWRAIRRRVPVHLIARADAAALLSSLRAPDGPSHVSLVPGQLARLLDAAGADGAPRGLRAVLLGGGAIPPALVRRAIAAGWPVIPTYGLTEMGSGVTALPSTEAGDAAETAGRPLPGMRVTILDPGPDGVGEILVAGLSRSSGYLDQPVRDPGTPVETGDLGRLDGDGRLIVVDRRTDRIVRGGENVSPAEVEAVLEAHPWIAEAAVVGRADDTWGQVPVAAIVPREGVPDPGDEALAAHVRSSLAGFKVPVAFTRLDALPRTSGGKLRREVVRALLTGERTGELARPDGESIGWRITGDGPRPVVLLHGTLSTSAQLDRLAAALAAPGDITVHALDRRGSGSSRLARPRALDVATNVDDLAAYLDARGIARAALVGVSFGGVLALEAAARRPDRVEAVVAYEPPYGAVADDETQAWFRRVAFDTAAAHADLGPGAAAQTFLRAVAGEAAWERLPDRARAFLEREGDGALADAGQTGLDPGGLARISAPVAILTGAASEPFYAPIADELARRVPHARRVTLDGATHTTPITDPAPVAAAIRACLEAAA
jgi:O-succinylbenzoic acid--CoA ligase